MTKLFFLLTVFVSLIASSTLAATVSVYGTQDHSGGDTSILWVVDNNGVKYPGRTSLTTGTDYQAWLDANLNKLVFLSLKRDYPKARYQNTSGSTQLEKFQNWLVNGAINTAYCKGAVGATEQICQTNGGTWVPQEVIVRIPFKGMWSLKKTGAEKGMKVSVLANKTDVQINTYIDNNVTDLPGARAFLRKLTKEVRDIIRRQGWE